MKYETAQRSCAVWSVFHTPMLTRHATERQRSVRQGKENEQKTQKQHGQFCEIRVPHSNVGEGASLLGS